MIEVKCEQRSGVWLQARRGIPTASQFHRIVTPTGNPSSQAEGYIAQLIAEYVLDSVIEQQESDWMMRGTELEEHAVNAYEMLRNLDTQAIGFVLHDEGHCGCSPDRLVDTDGGLEIKCPAPAQHVLYMLGSFGTNYKPQVQGDLWICEREWWDILSYNPELPPALIRAERDDKYIKLLAQEVKAFSERLADAKAKIEKLIE